VQYLLFIATDADPEPGMTGPEGIEEWLEEGARRGIRKQGHRLRPVDDATTIRLRGGELLVTDGPFAETKEWIAGFDILECENLDEVIDYASRHPMARAGRIEIRPFWPDEF
jgi:hypothetical protein